MPEDIKMQIEDESELELGRAKGLEDESEYLAGAESSPATDDPDSDGSLGRSAGEMPGEESGNTSDGRLRCDRGKGQPAIFQSQVVTGTGMGWRFSHLHKPSPLPARLQVF
ncbi:hypothetical protein BC826DRAFT_975257 [Russula brevipes]|nr:hypothetical protein BC826DRAFT_975257 [Russula brevipes]